MPEEKERGLAGFNGLSSVESVDSSSDSDLLPLAEHQALAERFGLNPYLEAVEGALVNGAFAQATGNKKKTAEMLRVTRPTVYEKLQLHDNGIKADQNGFPEDIQKNLDRTLEEVRKIGLKPYMNKLRFEIVNHTLDKYNGSMPQTAEALGIPRTNIYNIVNSGRKNTIETNPNPM